MVSSTDSYLQGAALDLNYFYEILNKVSVDSFSVCLNFSILSPLTIFNCIVLNVNCSFSDTF